MHEPPHADGERYREGWGEVDHHVQVPSRQGPMTFRSNTVVSMAVVRQWVSEAICICQHPSPTERWSIEPPDKEYE
jgi:hypothetical protein